MWCVCTELGGEGAAQRLRALSHQTHSTWRCQCFHGWIIQIIKHHLVSLAIYLFIFIPLAGIERENCLVYPKWAVPAGTWGQGPWDRQEPLCCIHEIPEEMCVCVYIYKWHTKKKKKKTHHFLAPVTSFKIKQEMKEFFNPNHKRPWGGGGWGTEDYGHL